MARKKNARHLTTQELEPQMQLNVRPRITFSGESLPLCKGYNWRIESRADTAKMPIDHVIYKGVLFFRFFPVKYIGVFLPTEILS